MKFTIVNSTDGLLHVHMSGCRDLDREMRNANGQYQAEGDNPDELIAQQIRDSDEGTMSDELFKLFPCAYEGCGKKQVSKARTKAGRMRARKLGLIA